VKTQAPRPKPRAKSLEKRMTSQSGILICFRKKEKKKEMTAKTLRK